MWKSKDKGKILLSIYRNLLTHFGNQNWWPGETRLEVCIGAILTQNTAWTNVESAINRLKEEGCLSAEALYSISQKKLSELIRPAGYYNIKAKRLKNFIDYLYSQYSGNIDKMFSTDDGCLLREDLLSLNGIGNETADSMLLYAGGMPFFVIDAYTKRIFSRIGLCDNNISYCELQRIFMKNLPKEAELYNEYHALIVMTGKNFCKKRPACDKCPLHKLDCLYSDNKQH